MSKKKPRPKNKKSARGLARSKDILDPPLPDRRALEAMMRQLVPGFTDDESDVDAAQQIMYEAFDATSPQRQMTLARKALEVSPDCADAYVLLAEYASTPAEELELYEQGVAAGERALGPEGFQEFEGHFWGYLPTRPYMRAREGLANCLWEAGRREEAADHCREMLRLNPNDNQGIRYRLAAMLLDLEMHDELEQLLKEYENDSSPEWAYTRALLAFRREGDTPTSRKLLAAAKKVNAHVPDYLARIKPMPREAPEYITMGGEDEAISYAAQFLPAWKETPGATAWLRKTLKLNLVGEPPTKRQPWSKLRGDLSQLPQRETETWELDLRHLAAPPGGQMSSKWMLVALNTADHQAVHFDFFDERPKDGEVWSFLVTALESPQEGEPHRPSAICVARKAWHRSWQPKLKDIDIECRLSESLEQTDHWFQKAIPQLEKAQRLADAPIPADSEWSRLASLPQRLGAIWQAAVEQLPVWLQVGGEPTRPCISLVADFESEAILATEIAMDEAPDDLLLKGLWHAFNSPAAGDAHRPEIIQVASNQQRDILAAHLESVGIQCILSSDLRRVRALIGELVTHLGRQQQQQKSLVHSPGVTPAQLGGFFEAAALFFRARPWRQIPGDCVFRVACERFESGPWYAVVMGQSGIEQGLALYEDFKLLRRQMSGDLSDEETARRMSAISVTYGEAFELAAEDVDAIEKHGWPVDGLEAYPCVLRVQPGMALRTPLNWELELLEGCLRAIPVFLGQREGRRELPVTVSGETAMFQLERVEDVE
jgi:tetratricopeptide (TPR) repeat protein